MSYLLLLIVLCVELVLVEPVDVSAGVDRHGRGEAERRIDADEVGLGRLGEVLERRVHVPEPHVRCRVHVGSFVEREEEGEPLIGGTDDAGDALDALRDVLHDAERVRAGGVRAPVVVTGEHPLVVRIHLVGIALEDDLTECWQHRDVFLLFWHCTSTSL